MNSQIELQLRIAEARRRSYEERAVEERRERAVRRFRRRLHIG